MASTTIVSNKTVGGNASATATNNINKDSSSSSYHNTTDFELPSDEAIPFDAHVNCGGFRWQVFEVSSTNGENVVNTVDWIVNAMLRGRKK